MASVPGHQAAAALLWHPLVSCGLANGIINKTPRREKTVAQQGAAMMRAQHSKYTIQVTTESAESSAGIFAMPSAEFTCTATLLASLVMIQMTSLIYLVHIETPRSIQSFGTCQTGGWWLNSSMERLTRRAVKGMEAFTQVAPYQEAVPIGCIPQPYDAPRPLTTQIDPCQLGDMAQLVEVALVLY
ncbi:hypothetical protein NM208_g16698 [Fusarium decemcellulare]|uniref:Uncharacterized protein n=1 Tax=Fusarium decemcellulare TaxID=57161 RepID=A0ACC1R9H1_9HYPO|nr:hypothetical protein NM208_g16698 [Fusarium decemcellulare]